MAVQAEDSMGKPELWALDLLRFLGALLVMLNHLRVECFAPFAEVDCSSNLGKVAFFLITRLGLESVMLFFVLSGFFVGGLNIRRLSKNEFDEKSYFIDRFTRIYVPLIPALIVALIECLAFRLPYSTVEFLVNLGSLQGVMGNPLSANSALWSLSYEVWFYLTLGAVLCFVKNVDRRLVSLIVLTACIFVLSSLNATYTCVWVTGLAAFFIRPVRPQWLAWSITFVFLIAGVVLMQITSESRQINLQAYQALPRWLAIGVVTVGFALLVRHAAELQNSRVRMRALVHWLASFSYSLYLFHIPTIIILMKTGWIVKRGTLNLFTLSEFLCLATFLVFVAYISFLLFESRTLAVRRLLRSVIRIPAR